MLTAAINKKLSEMSTKFVAEITEVIETSASEALRERMETILGKTQPTARISVASPNKEGKRNYHRKQCPYPGCTAIGAPRWSQFCPDHGKQLKALGEKPFNEAKATYHAEAQKPGGVWYEEKRATKRKAA
jgi:hypothetical protein